MEGSGLFKEMLKPYLASEVEPKGWLLRQLQLQAAGLSGNLDKVWRDVRDSKWIDGDAEGWERVPYWLDGYIPLAFLLRDQKLIEVARKYISAILANQCDDGWICPVSKLSDRKNYDVWAAFLIAKVITVYADCETDTEILSKLNIEGALLALFKNLKEHIAVNPLRRWSKYRWYECLIPIYWLYERRPEGWLLELATDLKKQGYDFSALLARTGMRKRWLKHYWNFRYHVVNDAMAIKSQALLSRITNGDPLKFAVDFTSALLKHHGMPIGHFSGDECLSGIRPEAGTELCGIVEAMYSYEVLMQYAPDVRFADALEYLCFNALPATLYADMWAHQYDQMVNQPFAAKIPLKHLPFTSNFTESCMYGLEPNFGCCTANFNQGFPKFALSQFYKGGDTIYIYTLAPSKLSTNYNGVSITVESVTEYPFKDTLILVIESMGEINDCKLAVRIPGFAAAAYVDGVKVKGDFYHFSGTVNGRREINIKLEYNSVLVGNNSEAYLRRGPLLFAVPIEPNVERVEYEKDGVERKYPYCDYSLTPKSKWNYAFVRGSDFVLERKDVPEKPFSAPAVTLTATLAEIEWQAKHNYVKGFPKHPKALSTATVTLVPYGCTDLRMTWMPVIEK